MFDENATTPRTLRNIKKSMSDSIERKYGINDEVTINSLLKLQGLAKENFDFVNMATTVLNNRINDVSIDDNANKNEKTVEGIQQETFTSMKKAMGFDYLYRQMMEMYGKPEAKRLTGEIYDYSLGLSDSTQILKNYCYAIDATRIITEGRPFGQLQSKPAKRLSSYISALCETIHQMSHHLAGACAISTFFSDLGYLALYREKFLLSDLSNPAVRKIIENELQQFVHSVNHLSRASDESPFTNLSLLDRIKIKKDIKEKDWLFTKEELEKITDVEYTENEYLDYITEYVMELQNIFLDFFDKGDPMRNGLQYRFPVVTLCLSKKKTNANWIVEDNLFLDNVCNRDIFRYNIFASEGDKRANCCRLISNSEMLGLASQVNSFGAGGSSSIGSHRVCTVNFVRLILEAKDEADFFSLLEHRIESSAKILKAHKELLKALTEKGLQMFIKMGWIRMDRLFSTVGIIGVYECAAMFKERFGNNRDVEGIILSFLNKKVEEMGVKYDIICNIEQIPGESFAVRFAEADRILFGDDKIPFPLYSNQFIPQWLKVSAFERLEMDGKYNQLLTGGGIVHITIGEKVTPSQAKKLIRKAIECGCEHFALNAIFSECKEKHISFGEPSQCPVCGSEIMDKYTRISGYFVPVSSWNKMRREWDFPNRYREIFTH